MKYNSKIGKKSLHSVLMLAVLICVVSSLTIGLLYRSNIMRIYKEQTLDYAYETAALVNGSRIQQYLSTGEKDDEYWHVYNYLKSVTDNSQLAYLYIFVPTDDGIVYIWDTDETAIDCGLGYVEEYTDQTPKNLIAKSFIKNPERDFTVTLDKEYGYLATAYAPIYGEDGEPVAMVGADLSMPDIQKVQLRFLVVMVLDIVAVLAVFNVIFYRRIQRMLVTPITDLNYAAKGMVQHLEKSQEIQLNIHTDDEIGDLGNTFSTMYHELQQYIEKLSTVTAERERIGAELNIATRIQSDMLPGDFDNLLCRKDLAIYASMDPAKEVGGDFYDFFMVDDNHIALVIADVSGKGVPAALFMVVAKTLLKNQASFNHSPAHILEAVNNQLCQNNTSDMFVTCWMCILEVSTGTGIAANAGHEYPMLRKADGDFEVLRDKHGLALGVMEDVRYQEYSFQVEPNGTLFVYTDGAAEATNTSNEMFGMERIADALNQEATAEPKVLIRNVKEGIDQFVGEAQQFDDITMLCIKRTKDVAPKGEEKQNHA